MDLLAELYDDDTFREPKEKGFLDFMDQLLALFDHWINLVLRKVMLSDASLDDSVKRALGEMVDRSEHRLELLDDVSERFESTPPPQFYVDEDGDSIAGDSSTSRQGGKNNDTIDDKADSGNGRSESPETTSEVGAVRDQGNPSANGQAQPSQVTQHLEESDDYADDAKDLEKEEEHEKKVEISDESKERIRETQQRSLKRSSALTMQSDVSIKHGNRIMCEVALEIPAKVKI